MYVCCLCYLFYFILFSGSETTLGRLVMNCMYVFADLDLGMGMGCWKGFVDVVVVVDDFC